MSDNNGRGPDLKCQFCRWWDTPFSRENAHGQHPCTKHAPLTSTQDPGVSVGLRAYVRYSAGMPIWPEMRAEQGCGDWELYRDENGNPGR